MSSRYAAEIEDVLLKYPLRTSAHVPEDYIGGGQSKLRYLGLRVPHLRSALKTGFSFSGLDVLEMAIIWDEVWHGSDCYEVMALALDWFYDGKRRSILLEHWPLLKRWSKRIDNWAHADALSGIYARILEQAPDRVYPTLVAWNKSSNPWLRRLSMVSLVYYSSQRETVLPLKKILALVEPQLDFEHHYVQRGVGWTLREAGNVYPEPTYRFIKRNITRLSAIAFSAATEKMPAAKKQHLKKLRRASLFQVS